VTTEKPQQPRRSGELQFKPLSAGLGFHPFSDGLPYAPVTKTPTPSTGHGAIAAGPARPVPAPRPVARVAVPTATVAPPPVAEPARPEPLLALETGHGFGYLIKRSLAYFTDSALNATLCLSALSAALWRQDVSPEALLTPGVVALCAVFVAAFNWAVIAAQEVAFGTSLGKRLFGLEIQGGGSAVFLRAFFFVPSVMFCGLGLVWALFDRRRRCWHDVAVDLQPTEIASL
jgi:hypothetical protein